MANQSIRAAFERLWQQIIVKLGNYSTTDHTHSYAGSSSAGGEATSAITLTGNQIGVTTAGTGAAYTATVSGITSLTSGVSFIMIPHTISTTTTPTLNVNGLGAKNIKRRLSNMGTAVQAGYTNTWLAANTPFRVIYDGMQWIVEGMEKPAAADLYGLTATITELNYTDGVTSNIQTQLDEKATSSHDHSASNITSGTLSSDRLPTVPIAKGGTGADTAEGALANLGGISKTLLWTNSSPTSTFAAQTISGLSLSNYTHYEIVYSVGYNYQNAYYSTGMIPIDKHAILIFGWGDYKEVGATGHRSVTAITSSSITFGAATFKPLTTDNNAAVIPVKIYGIKGV